MAECPDNDIKREIEHEQNCYNNAVSKSLREYEKACEQGRLADLPVGKRFVMKALEGMTALIKAEQDKRLTGMAGKYRHFLRKLPAETIAIITLRQCLFHCFLKCTSGNFGANAPTVLIDTGKAIESEILASTLQELKPWYVSKIHAQIEHEHSRSVSNIYRKYKTAAIDVGLEWEPWNVTQRMQVGKLAVNAAWTLGLFEFKLPTKKSSSQQRMCLRIVPSDTLVEYFDDAKEHLRAKVAFPVMLVPPADWVDYSTGGYFTEELSAQAPMMVEHHLPTEARRWVIKNLSYYSAEPVRKAMSRAQRVPYRVNKAVLEIAKKALANPNGVLGLPPHGPKPQPPFPFFGEWDKNSATEEELEVFRQWKVSMKEWHTYENTRIGRKLGVATKLQALSELVDEPRWYCPTFIDWRGRLYFRSTLNPQAADVVKGCIDFAEGKELGEEGLYWLKFQVANCCGYDKADPDLRVQWCDEHWEEIKLFLEDPLGRDPIEEDTSFTLLQSGYALREALSLDDPTKYVCHVPVALDATCSGLQHYSALLRDEIGGTHTNLVDNGQDQKHDIYSAVSNRALPSIPSYSNDPVVCKWWADHGISRLAAKRPVMTYVYGATLQSSIEYVKNILSGEGVVPPDGYTLPRLCTPAGKALRASVEAIVPKAKEGMDFLKKLVSLKKTAPLYWKTPVGVPVVNYCHKDECKHVAINCMGIHTLNITRPTKQYDVRSARNGISPNFIHSMDSAHLCNVINRFDMDIVPIHDSFAVHACDVTYLREVLLDEFAKLYEHTDMINTLITMNGIDLSDTDTKIPEHGSLDLNDVRSSRYAFC